MLITHCHFFFFPFLKLVLIITWIITGQTIFVFIFHLKPIWNSFYKFILFVFYLKQIWNSFSKIHSFVFYPKNILKFFSYNSFFYFLSQKHIWNSFYEIHFFFYLKNISEIIFIKLILSCIIVLDLYFLLKI